MLAPLPPIAVLIFALAPAPAAPQAPPKASELAIVADGKQSGNARAEALREFMDRAKAEGRCAQAAVELDRVILERSFPAWLRRVGAEAIAKCGDEATAKYVAAGIGRGETLERLHYLRAARGLPFKAADAALRSLGYEDPRVRCEAAELLARQKVTSAFEELAAIAARNKDAELVETALVAASALCRGTPQWPEWQARLLEWSREKDGVRKRAAIAELLAVEGPHAPELAARALADASWSVRVLGIEWLERSITPGRLDLLIARLAAETDGSRVHGDLLDALGRLTGIQRYLTHAAWGKWRDTAGRDWQPGDIVGKSSGGGTAERRSKAGRFYGVDIASARTTYVVDLSGSMGALSKSPGDEKLKRIDVARREMLGLVDALPAGSWFNIVGFGDTVHPWLDTLADFNGGRKVRRDEQGELAATAKKRDDEARAMAREWIGRLALAGSTNIYDALAFAFADPDVDTICFMTDGTPTIGTETEAIAIREELVRWNRSRKVRIHCIAVGEDNPLPKWIAADHGGVHRFAP
ncbi:MAG: hypothetical protein FJ294_09345 [Planctomycetes bacterium]|nr:hypothetical protein [Planctomycetota bacterium]